MQIFKNANFDFLRWRRHALAVSTAVILGGAALVVARGGLPLGVDFSGGTIVVLRFERPVAEDAVRAAIEGAPGEKVVQQYGEPGDNEVLVRLPQVESEEVTSLEQGAQAVVQALERSPLGGFEVLSTEIVGPVIGQDLQRKGIYATLFALVGIMVYIALRFNWAFGIGAIIAALHDILVTLAFLVFFGYELSLNVIAAILTITGYSVNDTIVVFDRARENLRFMRRDALADVINRSVNQTLARTIITSGTTFLAVLALYLFGGEVLEGFAFTMLVGVLSGTYSTVFIAAAIAVVLTRQRAAARRAAAVAADASAGRKKNRQVRAS